MTTHRILVVGAEAEPKTQFIQQICDTWSSHELDLSSMQAANSIAMDIGHLDYAEQRSVWYGLPASASPVLHDLAQTVTGCIVLIDPIDDNAGMLDLADQIQPWITGPIVLLVSQQSNLPDHLRNALDHSSHQVVDSNTMNKPESIHRIMTALGGSLPTASSFQTERLPVATQEFAQHPWVNQLFTQLMQQNENDIIGMALIDTEGQVLVSNLPSSIDPQRIAALSGTWLRIADKVADSAALEPSEETIIRSANGLCIIRPATDDYMLVTLLQAKANLGMFRISGEEMYQDLVKLLAA